MENGTDFDTIDDFWSLLIAGDDRDDDDETRFQQYLSDGWSFTRTEDNGYVEFQDENVESYYDYQLRRDDDHHHDHDDEDLIPSSFNYPFQTIRSGDYPPTSFYRTIPTVSITMQSRRDHLDFPDNIDRVYGQHCGYQRWTGTNEEWLLLGRLNTGRYFFYSAWCDNTGFDCQGGMSLYICHHYQTLIDNALTDRERERLFSTLFSLETISVISVISDD